MASIHGCEFRVKAQSIILCWGKIRAHQRMAETLSVIFTGGKRVPPELINYLNRFPNLQQTFWVNWIIVGLRWFYIIRNGIAALSAWAC